MIRVGIEAASTVVRAGLMALLDEQTDMVVVGAEPVDVWVTSLPDPFDQDAPSERTGDAPTVWLTEDESAWSTARWRDGLRAVLAPSAPAAAIVAAIRAAAAGLAATLPEALLELLPDDPPAADHDLPDLTTRESEVLQLLAAGLGNKGIARRLEISEHTVKTHVAAILSKLGAATRTEAVAIGARRGLVML